MVIKFYYSSLTSTTKLQKCQEHIRRTLDAFKVDFEQIDICSPEKEEDKKFMQANAKKRSANQPPLPPQLFNDETYCGDYDDFEDAIETGMLMSLLKMESHVSQATVTLSDKSNEEAEKKDAESAESEEKPAENDEDKETTQETVTENGISEESDDKPSDDKPSDDKPSDDKTSEQICEQDTEQVSQQVEQDVDIADEDDKVNVETTSDKAEEDVVNDNDKKETEESTSKSDEEPEEKNKSDEEQQQVQE